MKKKERKKRKKKKRKTSNEAEKVKEVTRKQLGSKGSKRRQEDARRSYELWRFLFLRSSSVNELVTSYNEFDSDSLPV